MLTQILVQFAQVALLRDRDPRQLVRELLVLTAVVLEELDELSEISLIFPANRMIDRLLQFWPLLAFLRGLAPALGRIGLVA